MCVERDDQLGGRQPSPDTEVDRVPSHHPTEKQIETLARAAGVRTGKEIGHPPAAVVVAINRIEVDRQRPIREPIQRRPNVRLGGRVAVEKKSLDRPRLRDHPSQDPEQRDQVHPTDPTVHEWTHAISVARGLEVADERGRTVSQHREQRLGSAQHARYPAERERRRAERNHLPVGRRGEATTDMDRIDRRFDMVEGSVEMLEGRLEPTECR
jgi:hypothetical protein